MQPGGVSVSGIVSTTAVAAVAGSTIDTSTTPNGRVSWSLQETAGVNGITVSFDLSNDGSTWALAAGGTQALVASGSAVVQVNNLARFVRLGLKSTVAAMAGTLAAQGYAS